MPDEKEIDLKKIEEEYNKAWFGSMKPPIMFIMLPEEDEEPEKDV